MVQLFSEGAFICFSNRHLKKIPLLCQHFIHISCKHRQKKYINANLCSFKKDLNTLCNDSGAAKPLGTIGIFTSIILPAFVLGFLPIKQGTEIFFRNSLSNQISLASTALATISVIAPAIGKDFFRLFPIISISQKFFSIFFLTLEKIGIDEKVICYHNISN